MACLGVRLSGGECYRRLLCLRFGVEYTALPLGTQKLLAFTRAECQRERGQRDCASTVEACATAEDVGKILLTESERHLWLNLLQTIPNGRVASVNWIEMAEEFTLWLQQGGQRSQLLAAALQSLRRGHVVSLVAWWAYVTCSKVRPIRRPSLMCLDPGYGGPMPRFRIASHPMIVVVIPSGSAKHRPLVEARYIPTS